MPKTNCAYSRTVIYKIVCNDLNITDCYVGHTTNFTKRKWSHKSDCYNVNKTNYNFNIYRFIRDKGGCDNWFMNEIEKCPCSDGNEARARERYWYEQLNATLNSEVPNRSIEEYLITNKETIKIKQTDYRLNNIDKIKIKNAEYSLKNKDRINSKCVCECGGKYTNSTKARHLKFNKHQNYINSLV